MTVEETLKPVAPPLQMYEGKTLRVTGTRIPLERVVYAFEQGQSPEEIIRAFPTLNLADVYAVIAYYLRHREPVDDYVRQQEAEADVVEPEVRAASPGRSLELVEGSGRFAGASRAKANEAGYALSTTGR
jgi:uncharacterized protein (DUF433 family)